MQKPRLNFWQIWNMSFGFLGIQFGWGLQMANMSSIYIYLGIPLLGHHAKTAPELLADLEHELRLFGHPVRLGPADGQHEFHLHLPRDPPPRASCKNRA